MVVRIVKDWPYPETFYGQTPKGDGVWEGVRFTEDPIPECDYLIVLQRPPYPINVKCPKGNAWLIVQEPPTDYFRFLTKSFKYFDRVYSFYDDVNHSCALTIQPVLPWHLLRSFEYLTSVHKNQLACKKNEAVWITSNKSGFPGQKARMILMDHFQKSNFKFQLYGQGFDPIHDKFDGLFPFKYSLAIENFSCDHYWTEKIADSFLSWCLPFYWGAGNLEDYFPSDSFIRIDVNDPVKTLEVIKRSIQDNEWEKRLDAIEVARNLILNEYQFFPYVSKMIVDDSRMDLQRPKKDYFIPANPYPLSHTVLNHLKYYFKRGFSLFRQG